MSQLIQLLLGILFAAIIAYAAYRLHSLSKSGAWGALLTGTVIFGIGGWQWAILLLAFFISSSALTRLFKKNKAALDEKFEKGGQRDIGQVLANGGLASIFAGLHFFFREAAWPWVGFVASLAAVNADTWATELGVLNPSLPRLITTWKPVEKGTSGAISVYGTTASLMGSFLIAILGAALAPSAVALTGRFWTSLLFFTLAGLFGALVDSYLGATIQAIYHCPKCDKETEKHPLHSCGTATLQVRGVKWMNNDMVNLVCAAAGTVIGLIL